MDCNCHHCICATCRHWGDEEIWTESTGFGRARRCNNPDLMACGEHCANPEAVDTLPDFGCNQWEAKPRNSK